ncbi:hypothetical protein QBC34DRAFT_403483 [Podospora aff. communis PSN243]|uniref:Uncharacterized protein n=1 Tax=Podospora aff. communis PSN243 TaxID=3040156 RepID=A0AAV9GQR7_9PEZI|nr:hypothetical protein QBC34DRAFT_403483 [Podospora aff. communis PSN243]
MDDNPKYDRVVLFGVTEGVYGYEGRYHRCLYARLANCVKDGGVMVTMYTDGERDIFLTLQCRMDWALVHCCHWTYSWVGGVPWWCGGSTGKSTRTCSSRYHMQLTTMTAKLHPALRSESGVPTGVLDVAAWAVKAMESRHGAAEEMRRERCRKKAYGRLSETWKVLEEGVRNAEEEWEEEKKEKEKRRKEAKEPIKKKDEVENTAKEIKRKGEETERGRGGAKEEARDEESTERGGEEKERE